MFFFFLNGIPKFQLKTDTKFSYFKTGFWLLKVVDFVTISCLYFSVKTRCILIISILEKLCGCYLMEDAAWFPATQEP